MGKKDVSKAVWESAATRRVSNASGLSASARLHGRTARRAADRRRTGQAMIYKRGKSGIYSYRFRFAGRMIHESARTKSKTLAREAERQRGRELEEAINNVKKRELPPTFKQAAAEWMESRKHLVRPSTVRMARVALNQTLPSFGAKRLCDIDAASIQKYQQRRLALSAQGRTINIETGVLRQILKAYEYWRPIAKGEFAHCGNVRILVVLSFPKRNLRLVEGLNVLMSVPMCSPCGRATGLN